MGVDHGVVPLPEHGAVPSRPVPRPLLGRSTALGGVRPLTPGRTPHDQAHTRGPDKQTPPAQPGRGTRRHGERQGRRPKGVRTNKRAA
ncbi:hypothetical protein STRIP9103_07211 [Streptomyces ipomoeae 91-03]|uniref:Uncharacterized protein n=1 Tax=Streptomyces ipomoeae 91-03 TaxID=698759 RepID=L1L1U1_9ACTN|nr:hypothetical protein STRIP9103_07211 [Streptomyces ipomoeae 91-03]